MSKPIPFTRFFGNLMFVPVTAAIYALTAVVILPCLLAYGLYRLGRRVARA